MLPLHICSAFPISLHWRSARACGDSVGVNKIVGASRSAAIPAELPAESPTPHPRGPQPFRQSCRPEARRRIRAVRSHPGRAAGRRPGAASARSVRDPRPRPARFPLSGAHAQAPITRRTFPPATRRSPGLFSAASSRENFPLRVRGVLPPVAGASQSRAGRRGGSIPPALAERCELPRRAIVHRVMRRSRQAQEVPQAVRILGIVLRRPDVMHDLRLLAASVPCRLAASVAVAPQRQHAQTLPALIFSRIIKHSKKKYPHRSRPTLRTRSARANKRALASFDIHEELRLALRAKHLQVFRPGLRSDDLAGFQPAHGTNDVSVLDDKFSTFRNVFQSLSRRPFVVSLKSQ